MQNQITIENRPRNDLGWTTGTATSDCIDYDFQVKHYDEPSVFGIKHERNSKLWLRRQGESRAVFSFDRGWEHERQKRGGQRHLRSPHRQVQLPQPQQCLATTGAATRRHAP